MSDAIEPPSDPWPRCGESSRIFEIELTCGLPRGHLFDGAQMHEDETTGSTWIITYTFEDGREERR